jgi:hypothetical protein
MLTSLFNEIHTQFSFHEFDFGETETIMYRCLVYTDYYVLPTLDRKKSSKHNANGRVKSKNSHNYYKYFFLKTTISMQLLAKHGKH